MKLLLITLLMTMLGFFQSPADGFYLNIKTAQAEKLIREHEGKGDMVILDVRTPGEYTDGHISGAVNIDFWSKGFADSVSKLDPKQVYLVYCTSGVRSGGAMKKMRKLGFERIYNMKSGMFGWRAAKLPLTPAKR
jgi:rhodanese-related sulfurtransferase